MKAKRLPMNTKIAWVEGLGKWNTPTRELLLKYWIEPNNHNSIATSDDNLMGKIKQIITIERGKSRTDCIFVYVALRNGSILITNDTDDIIDERTGDGKRRKKLLKIPKKIGSKKGADILTSEESYARIAN